MRHVTVRMRSNEGDRCSGDRGAKNQTSSLLAYRLLTCSSIY